jgi:hypothetical protein
MGIPAQPLTLSLKGNSTNVIDACGKAGRRRRMAAPRINKP